MPPTRHGWPPGSGSAVSVPRLKSRIEHGNETPAVRREEASRGDADDTPMWKRHRAHYDHQKNLRYRENLRTSLRSALDRNSARPRFIGLMGSSIDSFPQESCGGPRRFLEFNRVSASSHCRYYQWHLFIILLLPLRPIITGRSGCGPDTSEFEPTPCRNRRFETLGADHCRAVRNHRVLSASSPGRPSWHGARRRLNSKNAPVLSGAFLLRGQSRRGVT